MYFSYKPPIYLLAFFLLISIFLSTTSITTYDTTHNIITSSSSVQDTNDDVINNIYESWLVKHNKNYNVLGEKETRFEIFKDNVMFIDEWNSNEFKGTYTLGLNKFADLSNDEFRVIYFGSKQKPILVEWTGDVLPVNVDLREEQEHYEEGEIVMQMTVSSPTVGVAIETTGRDFQFYKSGVFTGRCGTSLDNAMIVIGDGATEEGMDYWIVKSSWGADWGENGYIRIVKCSIVIKPLHPVETIQNQPNKLPSLSSRPHALEVACDSYNSCPSQNTCCCMNTYGPYCLAWGCCPFESAVCCDDRSRCCPHHHPICDSSRGTCRKKKNSLLSVQALKRTPACAMLNGILELA